MPRLRPALLSLLCAGLAAGGPDLTREPTLFVVNYSHLDTEWRWAYPEVVGEMIPRTLRDNFKIMDAHPEYVFNWTGASRYQLMKEYLPDDYARLKTYVARGQWFPAGGSWEEGDVNLPSSESIFRQLLLGTTFFRREFGKSSAEFMLPDCFGFPASLPSILAHAGFRGFSTQKLTWHSAVGIPFDVGRWTGPDGGSVIAVLNGGDYAKEHTVPFAGPAWKARLDKNARVSGLQVGFVYNGVGDVGGAPHPASLENLWTSLQAREPLRVVAGPAETLFLAITEDQKARLPEYRGDLLLVEHSAGSLTSQAFMKRLNRQNELLADAAEKASCAAEALGAGPYPADTLRKAWGLVLRDQFHDILPGTSQPKVYEYAWNDGFLAARAFQGALADAAGAVARGLDTRGEGVPLVVFNPLGIERTDLVEARLPEGLEGSGDLVATDGTRTWPAQRVKGLDGKDEVLFPAGVPALSFRCFWLRAGSAAPAGDVKVEGRTLENARYRVVVAPGGDLRSCFDKEAGRELLAGPSSLSFHTEVPDLSPAWNMEWKDRFHEPRAYVSGTPVIRVVEAGPVRVAIEVTRASEGSLIRQTYRLATGSDRLEVANQIDWKTSAASLRAGLPFTVAHPKATYSWDLGTLERGNNEPTRFENPTHGWIDLTDPQQGYGVTLLTGAKYGSDKPDDHTLRLTLLYTPGVYDDSVEQRYQDWGRHAFVYGLVGHAGDWRQAKAPWLAQRQDQPLQAFAVPAHPGPLGRTFTLLKVGSDQVMVQALKKAEDGGGLVLRLQELQGLPAPAVAVSGGITEAVELDGIERPLGPLPAPGGTLSLAFRPYQTRTLGLKLAAPAHVEAPAATPLDLPYDLSAFSSRARREAAAMEGSTYPAEMVEAPPQAGGVTFRLGSLADGARNAVTCAGQVLPLPAGTRRAHLLVAAETEVEAAFQAGERTVRIQIPHWKGPLGQWDNRRFDGKVPTHVENIRNPLLAVAPAFLREGRPVWWASHIHSRGEDEIYTYGYLFEAVVEIPEGARSLVLPRDARVKVFAASAAATDNSQARPLAPFFPDLARDAAFTARFDHP